MNTNNLSKSVMVAAMLALLSDCDNRSASTTVSLPAAAAPAAQTRQVCYWQVLGARHYASRLRISGAAVTQVHEVRFTLVGDSLRWREGARIKKDGKWILATPDQGYQYVLGKVACAPQP